MMVKLDNQIRQVMVRLKKYYGQKDFTKTDIKAEIVSIKDAPLTLSEQDILFNNLSQEQWIEVYQQDTTNTFRLTKKALDELSYRRMLKLPFGLLRA